MLWVFFFFLNVFLFSESICWVFSSVGYLRPMPCKNSTKGTFLCPLWKWKWFPPSSLGERGLLGWDPNAWRKKMDEAEETALWSLVSFLLLAFHRVDQSNTSDWKLTEQLSHSMQVIQKVEKALAKGRTTCKFSICIAMAFSQKSPRKESHRTTALFPVTSKLLALCPFSLECSQAYGACVGNSSASLPLRKTGIFHHLCLL